MWTGLILLIRVFLSILISQVRSFSPLWYSGAVGSFYQHGTLIDRWAGLNMLIRVFLSVLISLILLITGSNLRTFSTTTEALPPRPIAHGQSTYAHNLNLSNQSRVKGFSILVRKKIDFKDSDSFF